MTTHIWYDRQGQPIDSATANELLGDPGYKRVAFTRITSRSNPKITYDVSTIWLGVDHNWGDGTPILFETMVFGGTEQQDQTMWRWHTEDQARAGHVELAASIAATVPDERVEEQP